MMGGGLDWACPMCGYGGGGFGWLGVIFFWIFALLIVAGITLIAIWIVRQSSRPHGGAYPPSAGPARPDAALDAARHRFATGEITKEQYEEIVRTLGGP